MIVKLAVTAILSALCGPHGATVVRYTDCEDSLKVPCITQDDGAWRKVTGYHPYRSTTVRVCTNGAPVRPCLDVHKRNSLYTYYVR
jgi:hypothetical protein